MERNLLFNFDNIDKICEVARALSIPARVEIMRMLSKTSMSVNEISEALDLPMSTVALHVNVLEEAGLLLCVQQPGIRGSKKVCSRRIDFVQFDFVEKINLEVDNKIVVNMPIGYYTDAQGIQPACGIVGENSYLGVDDDPKIFFDPAHYDAQLIWLSQGTLEYKFPNSILKNNNATKIAFSLELCSEISNYRNKWPSDITIWINGIEVCTYLSPGDFGGRRGKLNPSWWSDTYSQFGLLRTFTTDENGTYIDEIKASSVTVKDLNLDKNDYISFKIGVKPDAVNCGGMNIFGEKFGDHRQNIMMRLEYESAGK